MNGDLCVTQAPARAQCPRCMHHATRGGVVLAPRIACDLLADLELPHAARAVIERAAQEQAARGRCPNFSPIPNYPDAYRAEDLQP